MNYPNNGYPATYQNGMNNWMNQPSYTQPTQPMSYTPTPQQNAAPHFGDWVDGEDAARAYQFPQGWPIDTPMMLWDINDDVFYVKAKDSFGRPTQLKKARFVWEEPRVALPGQSGTGHPENYATKDDLQNLKNELIESIRSARQMPQQSGNRNGGNRE